MGGNNAGDPAQNKDNRRGECEKRDEPADNIPVSYTHLTLPTTPVV